jgi:hypothetical protein
LVTDQVEFPTDPDIPPMILDAPHSLAPIGSQVWIDKAAQPSWEMSVRVRELNLGQELKAHWRLVNKDDPKPLFSERKLPEGDSELRDLEFTVQSDSLRDGECARLDLAVSGSFSKHIDDPKWFDQPNNDHDDDLDTASWWIFEGEGPTKTSDADKARILSSCITDDMLLPQPMPSAMETEAPP